MKIENSDKTYRTAKHFSEISSYVFKNKVGNECHVVADAAGNILLII
jgi:hypothetical protein